MSAPTIAGARQEETLSRIPLFRSLGPEEIRRLDTSCTWRRAPAGEWILDYDDEGTDVFFVLRGEARVMIRTLSDRSVILGDVGGGGYFGEMAAIDGRPRSASILAITDAIVARMSASVFLNVVHAHRDMSEQLLNLLASRVRTLAERVNEFSTLDVRHRLYAELLRMAKPDRTDVEGRRAIISPPPLHADFAARIATRREAVARELKLLERAGLLEKRRGALVILDRGRLGRMVKDGGTDL